MDVLGRSRPKLTRKNRVLKIRPLVVVLALFSLLTLGRFMGVYSSSRLTDDMRGDQTHTMKTDGTLSSLDSRHTQDSMLDSDSLPNERYLFESTSSYSSARGFYRSAWGDTGHLLRVQGPGRCLNPHPGQFRFWYGQQDGCIVQVWRQWPDGCTHFQWFNNCSKSWDPQIYWTYCVH